MLDFDRWLNIYTCTGFAAVLVVAGLYYKTALDKDENGLSGGAFWITLFCGLLLFMRLPFIAYNRELDVDESQMLAQAMSLSRYWVYWSKVDGLTQGPLTSYVLILPSWIGMPFDYTSGRFLGYIILCGTLGSTFMALRNLFSKTIALAVFTPIALFYLLSQGAFSSLYNEFLVLLLLSLCFWSFSSMYRHRPHTSQLLTLGLAAGMVPFAKLQGVPTALVIVIFASVLVWQRSPNRVKALSLLAAAGLFFPLIVLALTLRYNVLDYFWQFYILGNMEYSSGGTIWQKIVHYPGFLRQSGQFSILFICNLGLIVPAALSWIWAGGLRRAPGMLFWFGLAQVITAFYVVIKSGYQFPHYQQFLIIPMSILTGSIAEIALAEVSWSRNVKKAILWAWLLICFFPHLVSKVLSVAGLASGSTAYISTHELGKPLAQSAVSKTILRFTRPGDAIAVWGWHPAYHLETCLPQAIADIIPFRILTPGPRQESHRERYLRDLERNLPVVFIDHITRDSFWFREPQTQGHDKIQGIAGFIASHYQHVGTVNGERIYVLKNRLNNAAYYLPSNKLDFSQSEHGHPE